MGQELVPIQTETLPVNTITGEIERQDLSVQFYQNASKLQITKDEQKQLQEPVDPEDIEIRPDGLIYYPQVFARQKLNDTFGAGQWALIEHGVNKMGNTLCFTGSLYIRGCFVAKAIGEHEYWENNKNQSWASVYEAAKSDCLVRCCKDLGIGKELWQPKYGRAWVKEHAVKVFVEVKDRQSGKVETKTQWRRKDQDPAWNEKGIAPGQNTEPPKQEPPKQEAKPKQEPKQEPKPKERNFTEEASKCKTLDDLRNWYLSLPKEMKAGLTALKNDRKKEIEKEIEKQKQLDRESLPQFIEKIHADISELELNVITGIIDDYPAGEAKAKIIKQFNDKMAAIGSMFEYTGLPF